MFHFDLSKSIENYYQEIGRGGRNPEINANCVLLYSPSDPNTIERMLNSNRKLLPRIFHTNMKKLTAMIDYCENKTECLMNVMLQYFNQLPEIICGKCANCETFRNQVVVGMQTQYVGVAYKDFSVAADRIYSIMQNYLYTPDSKYKKPLEFETFIIPKPILMEEMQNQFIPNEVYRKLVAWGCLEFWAFNNKTFIYAVKNWRDVDGISVVDDKINDIRRHEFNILTVN